MSRANPIGLRLASKKRNPPFIGVGQYYSYNQLKYNIVIHKSIKQLSKQLTVPAHQIVNRFDLEKKNPKNLVLYPSILPISLRLKTKQLFDSQYVLNRRRFYSVAIYITRLLKQQFEKNYNDFIKNSHVSSFFNDTQHKSSILNFPVASSSKYQKWKSKKLQFCSLSPSLTFAQAFFRVSQEPFLNHYDSKNNRGVQNQTINKRKKKGYLFEQTKHSKAMDFLFPTIDSDPYLILSYRVFSFGKEGKAKARKAWQKLKEFYFFTKKTNISINGLNFNSLTPLIKNKRNTCISLLAFNCKASTVFTLKKPKSRHLRTDSPIISRTNSLMFRFISSCPEWPLSTYLSPTRVSLAQLKSLRNIGSKNYTSWKKHLSFIIIKTKKNSTLRVKEQKNHSYFKAKKKDQPYLRDFGAIFFKNQSQQSPLKELYSKPEINYHIIKRCVLLSHLLATLPIYRTLHQKSILKKHSGSTTAISFPMAKEVENKQKRLYIDPISINKEEVAKTLGVNAISYTFSPSSSVTLLNLKNIKKLTKQIEHFRSDIKLLAPLELLLHRSFSEPVGIHCISTVDNRLRKTYCNPFLKNLLFTRTSNNFLKSSYLGSQIGLLKEKNAILFDFAYTKDSLIKLGLKKTNTLMQQLLETGHTKLWLRKLSSIRL